MTIKKDNLTSHSSSEYDISVRKTIPFYDNFHDETVNIIKASSIEIGNWLDTGCGTGNLVRKAFAEFPGARFILADPSREMIEQAKRNLDGLRGYFRFLPPVATQDLRINDKCDVITAIQSHHYLKPDERRAATLVCHGMLEKSGIFVTFENIRPLTKDGIKTGLSNWKAFQLKQGKAEKDAQKHIERFDKEYFPISIEEHLALYRECGFKTVEIFWMSYMQAGFYCIK